MEFSRVVSREQRRMKRKSEEWNGQRYREEYDRGVKRGLQLAKRSVGYTLATGGYFNLAGVEGTRALPSSLTPLDPIGTSGSRPITNRCCGLHSYIRIYIRGINAWGILRFTDHPLSQTTSSCLIYFLHFLIERWKTNFLNQQNFISIN